MITIAAHISEDGTVSTATPIPNDAIKAVFNGVEWVVYMPGDEDPAGE